MLLLGGGARDWSRVVRGRGRGDGDLEGQNFLVGEPGRCRRWRDVRNVRTPPKKGVLFAGGCCLLQGAVGEEGLDGPAQCWVCLVDCARITKDTDVLNPGIIILIHVLSRTRRPQICMFM